MSDETKPTLGTKLKRSLNPATLPLRQQLGLLGLAFLIALPLLLSVPVVGPIVVTILPANSWQVGLYVMTGALFFAMFAMSWDVVSGYTGEISFGHGLFFAVGGYTSTLLNLGYDLSPWLSIVAGIVMAAVAGVIIGVPSLRIEGPYLSLVTLVAPLILLQIFIFYSDIFGGELGLENPANLVGNDYVLNYVLVLVLFVAILAILWTISRSNTGSILTAIREDQDAVAASGLNPAKFKIFAFVLSAAIGGLAGAVYVHTPVGSATPNELFALVVNVEVIIAAVLGGMGTIVGAAVGGIFVAVLPNYLDLVDITVAGYSVEQMSFLLFAVITLVLLNVFPGGVLRWAIDLGRRVLNRGEGAEIAADGGEATTTPVDQTFQRYREYYRDLFGGDEK